MNYICNVLNTQVSVHRLSFWMFSLKWHSVIVKCVLVEILKYSSQRRVFLFYVVYNAAGNPVILVAFELRLFYASGDAVKITSVCPLQPVLCYRLSKLFSMYLLSIFFHLCTFSFNSTMFQCAKIEGKVSCFFTAGHIDMAIDYFCNRVFYRSLYRLIE